MIYDVIVVGSGPEAAPRLPRARASRRSCSTSPPFRDKVCGDRLTPQAITGSSMAAPRVLAKTNGCIKAADIIINKEHVLTGVPGRRSVNFAILLDRRRFDDVL
jgi:hypothetical protein